MKAILVASLCLFLAACGNPMTRLMPKLEKIEPPAELMEPPRKLKILVKPEETPNVSPE
jgi:hypothetical protein